MTKPRRGRCPVCDQSIRWLESEWVHEAGTDAHIAQAPTPGRDAYAAAMTERQLQDAVKGLAEVNGWLAYHTHDSRRSDPGFPDLTLAKPGRLVFAELKTQAGRVSPAQRQWLAVLDDGPADVFLWRPADLLTGRIRTALAVDTRVAGYPTRTATR